MIISKILSKKWWTNNWLFVFIFIFFLYINFLSPPIGDDLEIGDWFSISAKGNILIFLKSIYWSWKNFNGRGLSNFLMAYFCYYKVMWNFVSAGMFTFIICYFSKLFGYKKNKLPIALSILFVLGISDNIRMETYSLICANIAFMVPLILIILYLKIIKKQLNQKKKSKTEYKTSFLILISLLCLIVSTLMENISAGFTITLAILNIFYFIKTKYLDKLFLFSFIFSFLGSIFMFTSPGMHAGREVYNSSLGLFGTLQLSLFNNINLIVFENKFIFFIISLITILILITNKGFIQRRLIKYSYLSFLFLILFILTAPTTNYYINSFIPFLSPVTNFLNRIAFFLMSNRFIISSFWLIFLISFLIPILHIKKNKNILLFILSIAIFSLIPASLITQTGARIIMITVFCFIGIGCGILNQIRFDSEKTKKYIYWVILLGIFIQINRLSVMYIEIYKTQKIRQTIINNTVILQHQQLWNYKTILHMSSFKENTLHYTANPPSSNTYHYSNFIEYYQLDSRTKIVFE